MEINDLHTPDHELITVDGEVFCVDCQKLKEPEPVDDMPF